jgi:hypothetical protein
MSNFVARGQDRANLYQEITERIIGELETGRVPWVHPWARRRLWARGAEERRYPPSLFRDQLTIFGRRSSSAASRAELADLR